MMDVDSIVLILKLRLTPAQLRACHYLEAQGQRFTVDFGYQNAEERIPFEALAEIDQLERLASLGDPL